MKAKFFACLLLQCCVENVFGDEAWLVRFEEDGIVNQDGKSIGAVQLEFTISRMFNSVNSEFLYDAIETKSGTPFTLKLGAVSDARLEHEWKMFKELGATVEFNSKNKTKAESAEAGLPRVYGFGRRISLRLIDDTNNEEINDKDSYKANGENNDKVSGKGKATGKDNDKDSDKEHNVVTCKVDKPSQVLVMEPISDFLLEELMEWDEFANDLLNRYYIGLQLLRTIDYLHSKNVRHGNICPGIVGTKHSQDKQYTKIVLISIFTAEFCDDQGFLVGAPSYNDTEADYRSLHLDHVINAKIESGPFGPHVTDDNESAAFTIMRVFGILFKWEVDNTKLLNLSKELQGKNLKDGSKAKLLEKISKRRQKLPSKKADMTIRIHKKLRKDFPQCDVLLEMIESARRDFPKSIEDYDYKVKDLNFKLAGNFFIKMWEMEFPAFLPTEQKGKAKSESILDFFKINKSKSSSSYKPIPVEDAVGTPDST